MKDSDVIVRADGVWKKFCRRMRHSVKYGALDLVRGALGRRWPTDQLRPEEFWAVEDVSLELKRGDVLGVIGQNGSGKSTLLSMLNGIYRPDCGQVQVRGKAGALIKVGAGFHPMLTGRENIYVNAAILGMGKREVDRKLDAIIEFSGVDEFIDSPVKYYSSGMFVRLGFSVAAHLEPDLLLVDEVLAVGDADFRARCMQRMWEMVNSGNVAIVFVSHHMQSVDGLCNEIILLDHGRPQRGLKEELIAQYLGDDVSRRHVRIPPQDHERLIETWNKNETTTGDIQLRNVQIFNESGQEQNSFRSDEKLCIRLDVESQKQIDGVISSISLKDPCGLVITIERSNYRGHEPFTIDGRHTIEIAFESLQLKAGSYVLGVAFHDKTLQSSHCIATVDTIRVVDVMPNPGGKEGFFIPNLHWKVSKHE